LYKAPSQQRWRRRQGLPVPFTKGPCDFCPTTTTTTVLKSGLSEVGSSKELGTAVVAAAAAVLEQVQQVSIVIRRLLLLLLMSMTTRRRVALLAPLKCSFAPYGLLWGTVAEYHHSGGGVGVVVVVVVVAVRHNVHGAVWHFARTYSCCRRLRGRGCRLPHFIHKLAFVAAVATWLPAPHHSAVNHAPNSARSKSRQQKPKPHDRPRFHLQELFAIVVLWTTFSGQKPHAQGPCGITGHKDGAHHIHHAHPTGRTLCLVIVVPVVRGCRCRYAPPFFGR